MLILLMFFLPLAPSSGKIFWHRFFSRDQSIVDATAGWRRIYQAPMTINGVRTTLSIYGCDEPLELLRQRLKQNFNSTKQNYFIENENSFWILSAAGGQFSRLLALALPGGDKSLIFVFSRPPDEFSKATGIPPESILSGQELLPESRLETTIKNDETGASLETRIADAAPDVIAGEIAAKLSRRGWKQIYPGFAGRRRAVAALCRAVKAEGSAEASPAGNGGRAKQFFMVFRRGEDACAVTAGPALRENKSCVTILLKEKTGQ